MRWTVQGLTLTALLIATTGVQAQQPPAQQPAGESRQLGQPPQAQAAQQPQVVATVNGNPITVPELNATVQQRLAAMQQQAQAQGQELAAEDVQRVQQQTLDTLIESRLVEEYVTEQGPPVEQGEIESAVEGVKKQLASQQVPYDQFLATQGHTPESFQKRIEGSLAWQKFQQEQLSEEKLEAFFEQNKELFAGNDFAQAQQQVAQTYSASLWQNIVSQMKPKAKIETSDAGATGETTQSAPNGFAPQ